MLVIFATRHSVLDGESPCRNPRASVYTFNSGNRWNDPNPHCQANGIRVVELSTWDFWAKIIYRESIFESFSNKPHWYSYGVYVYTIRQDRLRKVSSCVTTSLSMFERHRPRESRMLKMCSFVFEVKMIYKESSFAWFVHVLINTKTRALFIGPCKVRQYTYQQNPNTS